MPEEARRPTSWSMQDTYRQAEEAGPRATPEPYTVPEGYKHPSMKEQWLYATRRHPYYRYGYALAVLVGLGAWGYASARKPEPGPAASRDKG